MLPQSKWPQTSMVLAFIAFALLFISYPATAYQLRFDSLLLFVNLVTLFFTFSTFMYCSQVAKWNHLEYVDAANLNKWDKIYTCGLKVCIVLALGLALLVFFDTTRYGLSSFYFVLNGSCFAIRLKTIIIQRELIQSYISACILVNQQRSIQLTHAQAAHCYQLEFEKHKFSQQIGSKKFKSFNRVEYYAWQCMARKLNKLKNVHDQQHLERVINKLCNHIIEHAGHFQLYGTEADIWNGLADLDNLAMPFEWDDELGMTNKSMLIAEEHDFSEMLPVGIVQDQKLETVD